MFSFKREKIYDIKSAFAVSSVISKKKENAAETYAELKEEYQTIKALLQVSGVNLTDIDKIKE